MANRHPPRETLIYSHVCARDRFWSSGKARCRFGSPSYRAGGATPPGAKTGRASGKHAPSHTAALVCRSCGWTGAGRLG